MVCCILSVCFKVYCLQMHSLSTYYSVILDLSFQVQSNMDNQVLPQES